MLVIVICFAYFIEIFGHKSGQATFGYIVLNHIILQRPTQVHIPGYKKIYKPL